MSEIWKPVPSLPGVQASSLGRLFFPNGKGPRVGWWCKKQKRYTIYWKSRRLSIRVARAVCEAFHGPPPFAEAVAMHLDEDSRNNKPENLAWGTQKENLNAPGFVDYCRSRVGDANPLLKSRAKRIISDMRRRGYDIEALKQRR